MKKKKGFTLIELLVTVVVLGVIVGLSIPIIRNIQLAQVEKNLHSPVTMKEIDSIVSESSDTHTNI